MNRKRRLDEVPIEKKSGLFGIKLLGGKKEIKKKTDYLTKIELEIEEATKEERKIDGDLILDKIEEIRQNHGNYTKQERIRGNCCFLITNGGEIIFYEGVKSGKLKIRRKDEKEAIINLPKQKLLSMRYGSQEVPTWIAYENESVALPGNTEIDSALAYQNIEEIISNRKNFEAQTLKAWGDLSWQLVIGFIVILAVVAWLIPTFTGESVLESIMPNTQETTTTTETDNENTIKEPEFLPPTWEEPIPEGDGPNGDM